MVGMYCAVSNCKNKVLNRLVSKSNVTFHRFPSDPLLREIWINRCNRGKDWNKQNVFMCSAHFAPSDFHHTENGKERKRTKLFKGAVPTRNLPDIVEPKKEIVILEVSSVGGKRSTKLIDFPAKKMKLDAQENVPPVTPSENGLVKGGIQSPRRSSSPLPVLEDASQSILYPPPVTNPRSTVGPNLLKVGSNLEDETNKVSQNDVTATKPAIPVSTGDLLVDRLELRIRELEQRIINQREKYKNKLKQVQLKYSNEMSELRGRVKELKAEVTKFNRMHTTMQKRGVVPPVTRPKFPPCEETPTQIFNAVNEMKRILERSFTKNQTLAMLNETDDIRWTDAELLNAYTLRHLSHRAYTFVKHNLNFPLPSTEHLTQWMSKIQQEKAARNSLTSVNSADHPEDSDRDEVDDISDLSAYDQCGDVIVEHPTGSVIGFERDSEDDSADDNQIIIIEGPTCTDGGSADQNGGHVGPFVLNDSPKHQTEHSGGEIVNDNAIDCSGTDVDEQFRLC